MSPEENHNRIDYVELPVRDVAEAKTFYKAVFDWTFQDYGPDYASFFDGRLAGGFVKADEIKAGGVLIVFYSKELESTQEKVTAAGGEILKPTFEFPGGRRFHFVDPSGNELAVWSESTKT